MLAWLIETFIFAVVSVIALVAEIIFAAIDYFNLLDKLWRSVHAKPVQEDEEAQG